MVGSRNRAIRRRQNRRATPAATVEDIKTAANRFLELPDDNAFSTLNTHLQSLVQQTSHETQNLVGSSIFSLLQTHTPSPIHRVRLAELAERMTEWHSAAPEQAISVITDISISCVSATDARDTAALAACMRAVTSIANAASNQTRDILERKIPLLIEPLHNGLFRPRAMYPTTPDSDGALSASMGSASNSDADHSVRHANTQLVGIRLCAIDALVALGAISSRALVPFWSLFLPERDGVAALTSSTRENLASIILFERRSELRSRAVTAATALIVTSRRFLQTVTSHRASDKSQAFTSTSSRVLRTCVAMHTVVASALRKESNPIILAKLAKLASELAANTSIPAVPEKNVLALLRELMNRVVDSQTTDLTTRSAAASAMAVVIGKSGQFLNPAIMEQTCKALVESLKSQAIHPSSEIINVFSALVQNHCRMFLMLWRDLQRPDPTSCQDEASFTNCLHFARLIETFLKGTLGREEWNNRAVSDHGTWFEHRDTLIQLHNDFLQHAIHQSYSALQISAIVSLDYILQLSSGSKMDNDTVSEIIDSLKNTGINSYPLPVRMAALRALASFPLIGTGVDEVMSIMEYFDVLIRSEETELQIRSKSMTSYAILLRRIEKCKLETTAYLQLCRRSFSGVSSVLDTTAPKSVEYSSEQSTIISAARTAACSFIVSFICVHIGNSTSDLQESIVGSIRGKGLERVLRICQDKTEQENTRCTACKMLGDVIEFSDGAITENKLTTAEHDSIIACMRTIFNDCEPTRVQIFAVRSLKRATKIGMDKRFYMSILCLATRCYLAAKSSWPKTDLHSQARYQHSMLTEEVCGLVYVILDNVEEKILAEMENLELRCSIVIECVLRHLSLPTYVTEHLGGRANEDSEAVVKSNSCILFESLPEASQNVIMKALSLGNGMDDDGLEGNNA